MRRGTWPEAGKLCGFASILLGLLCTYFSIVSHAAGGEKVWDSHVSPHTEPDKPMIENGT